MRANAVPMVVLWTIAVALMLAYHAVPAVAAARRGATFDILELADEKEPSVAYAQMMEDVRHLRYAGVFVRR